mgnify:CR=1 FL=1
MAGRAPSRPGFGGPLLRPRGTVALHVGGTRSVASVLGPWGLSRMVAEQEAAMTEHGPPLNAVLGPRPRGTVALHWMTDRSRAAMRDRGFPWRDALRRVRFRASRFVPYGCRTRGGHDRAWPSIGCRPGPAATRDRGPPCWRDALRRVRVSPMSRFCFCLSAPPCLPSVRLSWGLSG